MSRRRWSENCWLVLVAGLCWAAPAQAAVGFSLFQQIDSNDDGTIELGDVTGDGFMDLGITIDDGGSHIYHNNQSGMFSNAWNGVAANEPQGFTFADVDGDGDLDIMETVAGSGDGQQAIYMNPGNGNNFTAGWDPFDAVGGKTSFTNTFADFDNDGDMDLLMANGISQASYVFRNQGTGADTTAFTADDFIVAWDSVSAMGAVASHARAGQWGDLNNDGRMDFVLCFQGSGNRAFLNQGNGADGTANTADDFMLAWTSPESEDTYRCQLGDYDADGKLDLVAPNNNQANRIYHGNGDGTFTSAWTSPQVEQTFDAAWGDFDNDGDLDVVFANFDPVADRGFKIFRNDGGGTFTLYHHEAEGRTIRVLWGDVDNDGDLDLVTNRYQSTLFSDQRIWKSDLNSGSAPDAPALMAEPDVSVVGATGTVVLQWGAATDDKTPAGALTYNLRVGTSTGANDVMSAVIRTGPGNVGHALQKTLTLPASGGGITYFWSVQAVDGTYTKGAFATEDSFTVTTVQPFSVAWSGANDNGIRNARAGDTDGDGDLDLVVAGYQGVMRLRVLKNNGDNTFTEAWADPTGRFHDEAVWGDYDNDGDLDLAVAVGSAANLVFRNDGNFSFTQVWTSPQAEHTPSLDWADVNGDGKLDLVFGSIDLPVRVFLGDGAGNFTEWANLVTSQGQVRAGDFDRDGDTDILVAPIRDKGHTYSLWRNDGATFTNSWNSAVENKCADHLRVGDMDGDGWLDFAVACDATKGRDAWKNNGNGTFTSTWTATTVGDTAPLRLDVADADNDGDLDIFAGNWNGADNHEKVFLNAGAGDMAVYFTGNGDQNYAITTGDFDNDGDVDFFSGSLAGHQNRLYRNNLNPTNNAPTAPTLTAQPDGVSGGVVLRWSVATDADMADTAITYNLRVGTSSGARDVVSDVVAFPSGNAGAVLSRSLTLPGGTYFWSVQAVDTGFRKSAFATEDSFLLDGTAPTAGTVADDGTHTTDNTQLSASWSGFADAQTGVAEYSYSIGTSAGDASVVTWTSVGTNTAVTKTGLALTDGQEYFINVRAKNTVGLLSSVASSDGITVDTSAPTGGTVDDGETVTSATTVSASWSGFADAHSGITEYSYSVGTSAGAVDLKAWTGAGTNTTAQITGLTRNLNHAETIFVNVQAKNGAGLVGGVKSGNGAEVVLDTTPPTAGTVTDDGQFTTAATTLSASWTGFTDDKGVTQYSYSIGTSAGDTSVVDWTAVGTNTTVTKTGLALTDGQQYFVNVRAKDAVNLVSAVVSSDGITVDASAPAAGTVNDDGAFTSSNTQLSASWTGFVDAHSGVTQYSYSIGTTAGGTDVVDWTAVGTNTVVMKTGLNLTDGQQVFINVRGKNGAGLLSAVTTSDGITPDASAPSTGTISDEGVHTTNATQLTANWTGFADTHSGIAQYSYSIGTTAGGTDVVDWTAAGTNVTVTKTGLMLTDGQQYFISVRAENGAGLQSGVVTTDGILVDASAPVTGQVFDDGQFTTSTTTLSASWEGMAVVRQAAATDPHSGIAEYSYSIGTSAGDTGVVDWTSVGTATQVTRTDLSLTSGTTYFFNVRSKNPAGLLDTVASSDGITVDATPPAAVTGLVDEGVFTTSTTSLSVSWKMAADPESGVVDVSYSMGTTPFATNILPWISVGTATHAAPTGLSLVNGLKFFVNVRVQNGAGLLSPVVFTDGIVVDAKAPGAVGQLVDGTGATDVATQAPGTSLAANWTAAVDGESGVREYVVSVGTTPGAANVVASQSVGLSTSVIFSGVSTVVDTTYYVNVAVVDNVGHAGPLVSTNGVLVKSPGPPCATKLGDVDGDCDIDTTDGQLAAFLVIGTTPAEPTQLDRLNVIQDPTNPRNFANYIYVDRCAKQHPSVYNKPNFPWCP